MKLARLIDNVFWRKQICWIYILFAACSCAYLAFATPPFQTPDAANHFFRSYQVSKGTILQKRIGEVAGGNVDTGITAFAALAAPLQQHPEVRWTPSLKAKGAEARLSHVEETVSFANTAPYPVWNYLPQAAVLFLFAHTDISLAVQYQIVCLVDAIVAILLTVLALHLSRLTRPLLFTLALLPETLSLFTSVSQDSTLIPLTFLFIAIVDNLSSTRRRVTAGAAVGMTLLLVAIAAARLPYLTLMLLFFSPTLNWSPDDRPIYGWMKRLAWAVVSVVLSVAIFVVHSSLAGGRYGPETVSMPGQIHFLTTHLSSVPALLIHTLHQWLRFYIKTFIAGLGWFDTWFPDRFYPTYCVVLLASIVLPMLRIFNGSTGALGLRISALLAFAGSAGLILLALYLTYTPVGDALIVGVQGRYFIPVFPLIALMVWPPFTKRSRDTSGMVSVRALLAIAILAMPIYSLYETTHVIHDRYYAAAN